MNKQTQRVYYKSKADFMHTVGLIRFVTDSMRAHGDLTAVEMLP